MKKAYFLLLFITCLLVVNSSCAYEDKQENTDSLKECEGIVAENNTNLKVIEINTKNTNNTYNTPNTPNTPNTLNTFLKTSDKDLKSLINLKSNIKTKTVINTINENDFYKNRIIQLELVNSQGKRIPNANIYMTLSYANIKKTTKLTTDKNGLIKVGINVNQNYNAIFTFKETDSYLGSEKKVVVIKELSLDKIITASKALKQTIKSSYTIPKKIQIDNTKYTIDEFLYLMAKAVLNINNKDNSAIKIKAIEKAPNSNLNMKELEGKIYNKEIIQITKNLINFMNSKSRTPNYVVSSLGEIPYNQTIHMYSKILSFYKNEKRLCNYVSLTSLKTLSSKTKITSENKYTNSELLKYLKESKNCNCNNVKIKQLTKTLTSTINNIYKKAKIIFNYVRDKISYSNYNNTKKGAVQTLIDKCGNCVDQSHLLIALSRAANIPARYVHGSNCKFSSGKVCGHVWVELLINNKWYTADPTSSKNSLGIINNWNTKNYKLNGKFISLNF